MLSHRTQATISLGRLRENIRNLQNRLLTNLILLYFYILGIQLFLYLHLYQ